MCVGTLVVVVDSILYIRSRTRECLEPQRLATTIATASTFPFFWYSSQAVRPLEGLAAQASALRLVLHAFVTPAGVPPPALVSVTTWPMFACW